MFLTVSTVNNCTVRSHVSMFLDLSYLIYALNVYSVSTPCAFTAVWMQMYVRICACLFPSGQIFHNLVLTDLMQVESW